MLSGGPCREFAKPGEADNGANRVGQLLLAAPRSRRCRGLSFIPDFVPGLNLGFVPDHGIAIADQRLELAAVDNSDVTATVANCPGRLQTGGSFADGFATHPQQVGDLFVRQADFVAWQAIKTRQQPAAKSL